MIGHCLISWVLEPNSYSLHFGAKFVFRVVFDNWVLIWAQLICTKRCKRIFSSKNYRKAYLTLKVRSNTHSMDQEPISLVVKREI